MSVPKQAPPRILHCRSAADATAMQARFNQLIAASKGEFRHVVAGDGHGQAATLPAFPPLAGAPWPGRLKRLAAAMAGYDLLCTWGAGALDAALAHTLFADVYQLAPLVHHEGAGEGQARSTLARRIALGRTAALVVPTRAMERLALERWQQPRHRVRLIPEGIDTAAFTAATPRRDAVPGLVKRRGELWLGTFATAGEVERLRPLIAALAALPDDWQLVVAAAEASHRAIVAEGASAGIEHRVHPVTPAEDCAPLMSLFDLFAPLDASGTLEAMAAGLPVATSRDSEAAALVASENGPLLASENSAADLTAAISRLAGDKALRRRVGEANRARARTDFDQRQMIERTCALYRSLVGQR